MGVYNVKMGGMVVRQFADYSIAKKWAKKHCHGKVEIVKLVECQGLPKACNPKIKPSLAMADLRYRPFVELV